MRLNRILLLAVVVALAALVLPAGADGNAAKDEGTAVELAGEVVDLRCYGSRGARGEEHRECAIRCVNSGAPVGFVTDDGQLHLLLGKDLLTKLEGKVGVPAKLKGRSLTRDGMQFVFVDSVELKPVAQSRFRGAAASWWSVVWWFLPG